MYKKCLLIDCLLGVVFRYNKAMFTSVYYCDLGFAHFVIVCSLYSLSLAINHSKVNKFYCNFFSYFLFIDYFLIYKMRKIYKCILFTYRINTTIRPFFYIKFICDNYV